MSEGLEVKPTLSQNDCNPNVWCPSLCCENCWTKLPWKFVSRGKIYVLSAMCAGGSTHVASFPDHSLSTYAGSVALRFYQNPIRSQQSITSSLKTIVNRDHVLGDWTALIVSFNENLKPTLMWSCTLFGARKWDVMRRFLSHQCFLFTP